MSLSVDKKLLLEEISKSSSIDDIEKLRIRYLGKKGLISSEMKSLSSLSIEEKKLKDRTLIFLSLFLK